MSQLESAPDHRGDARFTTTRRSLVIAAGCGSEDESREAFEFLCREYWQPFYFFIRHRGHGIEDAGDLIQGFFAYY